MISSFCAAGHSCVDVKFQNSVVVVYDTKNYMALPLIFTLEEWDAFIKGAKNGEFDVPGK